MLASVPVEKTIAGHAAGICALSRGEERIFEAQKGLHSFSHIFKVMMPQ